MCFVHENSFAIIFYGARICLQSSLEASSIVSLTSFLLSSYFRYAQQTDAGQLSRCLLLAPRATVNVKPNLQIIADDVKCSHGAAISDFEGEQLFYFQARGIDVQTARSALVFSFGAEVIDRLVYKSLRKRVETLMKSFLAQASAIATNVPEGL